MTNQTGVWPSGRLQFWTLHVSVNRVGQFGEESGMVQEVVAALASLGVKMRGHVFVLVT